VSKALDNQRTHVSKQLTVAAHRHSLGAGQTPADQVLPADFSDASDFGNPRAPSSSVCESLRGRHDYDGKRSRSPRV